MTVRFTIRWPALRVAVREGRPAWICIAVIVFASLIGWMAVRLESVDASAGVRWAGMVLQWSGILTIARGLSDMRGRFGRPTLASAILGWFRGLVSAFKTAKTLSAIVTGTGGITTSGEVHVRLVGGPGASVDQRLAALEENLTRLQKETDQRFEQARRDIAQTQEMIQREGQEREAGEQRIRRDLEEVAVGGLRLESIGLIWLFLGVIYTSIPEVVAAAAEALRGWL